MVRSDYPTSAPTCREAPPADDVFDRCQSMGAYHVSANGA